MTVQFARKGDSIEFLASVEKGAERQVLQWGGIAGIAGGLRQVAALPDPVGEVAAGYTLPNGLRVSQVRVPLGVVGMVYEARPNVTVDAAAARDAADRRRFALHAWPGGA